jgi:hypothetical protein
MLYMVIHYIYLLTMGLTIQVLSHQHQVRSLLFYLNSGLVLLKGKPLRTLSVFSLRETLHLSFYRSLGVVLLFRKRSKRKIAVFVTLVFFMFILFHGRAYAGYGYGRETLQSTVLRYLLPVYVVLPIGFAGLLDDAVGKMIKFKNIKVLFCSLLGIVMLASLSFTIKYPDYGLDMFEGYRQGQIDVGNQINSLIPVDAIIITDQVCVVISSEKHDNVIFYPRVPESMRYQEIQRVLTLALEDGRKVYFAGAFYQGVETNTEILGELSSSFMMTKLTAVHYINIYKVSSQ